MRDIFNPEPPDVNIPDATPPVPRPNPIINLPPIAQAHPQTPAWANLTNHTKSDRRFRTRAGRESVEPAWLRDFET